MTTTTASDDMKSELYIITGDEPRVELPSSDNGVAYGVWVGDDLIGHGGTEVDALADALTTARGWA